MNKKFILGMSLILFSIYGAGCAARLVDFTVISTKNIDLSRGADFQRGQSRVTGEDSCNIIIIIPTGTPNIKQAIDRAIESVPGAVALLDGVVTSKTWGIPFVFGRSGFVVEGTPLIDSKLVKTAQLPSKYIITTLDKKGGVIETKYVSKTEFESTRKHMGV